MATFSTDTDLGTQVIGAGGSIPTKIWSNGVSGTVTSATPLGFAGSDPTNVTISANDITVVTNRLGNDAGSTDNGKIDLNGCILNLVENTTGGAGNRISGRTNTDFELVNTKVVGVLDAYAVWGAWDTSQGQYILEDFTLAVDIGTGDLATFSLFTGNLSAGSRFERPAFWNGLTGADAKGGVWQTSTGQIYNGIVTPPAGIDFNVTNVRVFHRWSNQATGGTLTSVNHTGVAPNFDFRSLQHVANSTGAFFLDVDGASSIAHVNWLPGTPVAALRHGFKSFWGGGGRAQVFIATNPILENPVGVDGTHLLNFSDADIASTGHLGVYLPATEAWNPAEGNAVYDAQMITTKSNSVTNATLNGLFFRNQKFNESSGTQTTAATNFDAFEDLVPKTYRKYSWLQQPAQTVLNAAGQTHREWMDGGGTLGNFVPDDSQSSGFGKLLTVAVPPNNASDAEVQTARDGGYDIYNGTTWDTSTDISDGTDVIMRDANNGAFDTFDKAFAIGNGGDTGGFTTGSGVLAGMKALAYHVATGASDARTGNVDYVGTDNSLIETHYTVTGTTVDFDGILGLHPSSFDYRSADIQVGGNNIRNRFVRINHNGTFLQDEFVTAFTAEQIRINGDVDGSQANCDLSARDSIRFNSSISNLVLRTRKTDGLGTISAPDNSTPTPSLLTYDADIILARQPSGTYTTQNLLGTGYAITNGAYNTLRTEVGTSYTIEATDANVAEFGLTANADGTGGELQRGFSVTVAPTGYGSITWMRPAAPIAARPILIDMPAGTTGRFEINNSVNDTVFYAGTWAADGTVTSTTDNRFTDSDGIVGVASNDATVYQWFIKPDSVIGGDVYRLNGGTFQGTTVIEGAMVNITTTQVNNFFVQNATLDVNEGTTTRTYPALTSTSAANKFNFIFSGTSSSSRPSGNGTQALVIEATNLLAYWTWLVTNNYQADPVDYRPASTIWNNSADNVTGIATADGVFCNSTSSNVGNFCSNAGLGLKTDDSTLAGSGQVQSSDEDQASLATVNNAIAGLFAANAGVTDGRAVDIGQQIVNSITDNTVPGKGVLGKDTIQ